MTARPPPPPLTISIQPSKECNECQQRLWPDCDKPLQAPGEPCTNCIFNGGQCILSSKSMRDTILASIASRAKAGVQRLVYPKEKVIPDPKARKEVTEARYQHAYNASAPALPPALLQNPVAFLQALGEAPPRPTPVPTTNIGAAVDGIPADCVGYIVGKGRATVKRIKSSTGCSTISTPRVSSEAQFGDITLRGTADQIAAAISQIDSLVAQKRSATSARTDARQSSAMQQPHQDVSSKGLAVDQTPAQTAVVAPAAPERVLDSSVHRAASLGKAVSTGQQSSRGSSSMPTTRPDTAPPRAGSKRMFRDYSPEYDDAVPPRSRPRTNTKPDSALGK